MTNKSRDNIAINLIDLESEISEELLDKLRSVEHILMVKYLNLPS